MTTWPLATERLVLRPFTGSDVASLLDLQSRPDVVRYLMYGVRDESEVREALAKRIAVPAMNEDGQVLSLAVELRGAGEFVGEIVLFLLNAEQRQGEIGFVFHPDHHGRGYASEAAATALRLAFDRLGMRRVIGRCDARNSASAALMRRLGMRQEAHFVQNEWIKGEWTDELVFAMLAEEHARQPVDTSS